MTGFKVEIDGKDVGVPELSYELGIGTTPSAAVDFKRSIDVYQFYGKKFEAYVDGLKIIDGWKIWSCKINASNGTVSGSINAYGQTMALRKSGNYIPDFLPLPQLQKGLVAMRFITDACNRYGVKVRAHSEALKLLNHKLESEPKEFENAWDYIDKICSSYGCIMSEKANGLYITKAVPLAWTEYTVTPKLCISYSATKNLGEVPSTVTIVTREQGREFLGVLNDTEAKKVVENHIKSKTDAGKDAANAKAQTLFMISAMRSETVTVTMLYDAKYQIGDRVKLEGFNVIDGSCFIVNINASLKASGTSSVTLTLVRNISKFEV